MTGEVHYIERDLADDLGTVVAWELFQIERRLLAEALMDNYDREVAQHDA